MTESDQWSHDLKMAAFSCLQIFLMIGMLVTGSINTLSKKAQNDSVYVINDMMLYEHSKTSRLKHMPPALRSIQIYDYHCLSVFM